MKQCKGCGAPLEWSKGNACEYCGTPFRKPREDFFLDMSSGKGVLKLDGKEFNVMLTRVRAEEVGPCMRGPDGRAHIQHIMRHEFTLMEV